MNEKKITTATPDEVPADAPRSNFLDAVRSRAEREGKTVGQVLREAKSRVSAPPTVLTEDCLLPDEVEQLMLSPRLAFDGVRLTVRNDTSPTSAERDALSHAESCAFCSAMLASVAPRAEERKRLLEAVRRESARRASEKAVDVVSPPSPLVRVRRGFPVLLPVALAIYAMSQTTASSSLTGQAIWAAAPQVVVVGTLVGVVGWLRSSGSSVESLSVANKKPRTRSPTLVASLVAALAMVFFAGGTAWMAIRSVDDAQTLMVRSALSRIGGAETSAALGNAISDEDCVPFDSSSTQVCTARESVPVSGQVVGELGDSKADIYWFARGEQLRKLQLISAKIMQDAQGKKALRLFDGVQLPLDMHDEKEYPIGASVIAVKGDKIVTARVLKGLEPKQSTAEYSVITTHYATGESR